MKNIIIKSLNVYKADNDIFCLLQPEVTYVTGTVDYVTEGRNASGLTVRPTVTVDRDGPGHSVRKEVDVLQTVGYIVPQLINCIKD